MKRLPIILSLLILPAMVYSEPATVLTGEHPTFTRVVVSLPSDGVWELGRYSDGYILRIPSNDGYALERFFDLIPKSRIAEVFQGKENYELYLAVSCLCHVSAQIFDANYLVLDVRDGSAPPGSPFERQLPNLEGPPAANAVLAAEASPIPRASERLLPLILPGSQSDVVNDTGKTGALAPEAPLQVTPADMTLEAETLDQIVQSLSEGVGRGLTEGVLQGARSPDETEARDDVSERVAAFPGVRAQTSIDASTRLFSNDRDETQTGVECLPAAYFDVASWGSDRHPLDQLGAARRNVIDAAGQINSDAVLALAQLYVFLGFGQEAAQALKMDGIQSRERVLLGAIARIIDEEQVDRTLFQGQVSCPSNVAVWALLAGNSSPTDALVDRMAVVTAYDALPRAVQASLAPRLAERLMSVGARDEALQVLGSDLLPDLHDVELTLAKAALADALGESENAHRAVAEVARNAPHGTAIAMAQFFQAGIAKGATFSDGDFMLADAIRFENGDNPDAIALTHAQILAYVSNDRFGDARTLLGRSPAVMLDGDRQALVDDTYLQATLRLSDGQFVEFVWDENPSAIGSTTKNAIAERLTVLGFVDQAGKFSSAHLGPLASAVPISRNPPSEIRDDAQARPADLNVQNQEIAAQATAQTSGSTRVRTAQTGGAILRESRKLVEDSARSRSDVGALLNQLSDVPPL